MPYGTMERLPTDLAESAAGSGPGLSIVRAVAHAHGGDVDAVPRSGGGITVTVSFPTRVPGSTRPHEPARAGSPRRRCPSRAAVSRV